jgi:hypothetical protein
MTGSSMFYRAAKLLTLFSVILHAGVGCCAHHEHCSAQNSPDSVEKQQEPSETHQCSCKFHTHCNVNAAGENADNGESEQSSCPCGESHGGCSDHCSWLTCSRVQLPTDSGIVLPASLADVWSLHTLSDALTTSNFSPAPPLKSEITDSLRAKTQVWRL